MDFDVPLELSVSVFYQMANTKKSMDLDNTPVVEWALTPQQFVILVSEIKRRPRFSRSQGCYVKGDRVWFMGAPVEVYQNGPKDPPPPPRDSLLNMDLG